MCAGITRKMPRVNSGVLQLLCSECDLTERGCVALLYDHACVAICVCVCVHMFAHIICPARSRETKAEVGEKD